MLNLNIELEQIHWWVVNFSSSQLIWFKQVTASCVIPFLLLSCSPLLSAIYCSYAARTDNWWQKNSSCVDVQTPHQYITYYIVTNVVAQEQIAGTFILSMRKIISHWNFDIQIQSYQKFRNLANESINILCIILYFFDIMLK